MANTTRKPKKARLQSPEPTPEPPPYSSDDEDNLCRCICANNDFTAKRPWIQCTACGAWQHNDCMDVSVYDDELGEHYWCEECDPESHAVLLGAVDRGERPWEKRGEERLEVKGRFEKRIKEVLEEVEWLWGCMSCCRRLWLGIMVLFPRSEGRRRNMLML